MSLARGSQINSANQETWYHVSDLLGDSSRRAFAYPRLVRDTRRVARWVDGGIGGSARSSRYAPLARSCSSSVVGARCEPYVASYALRVASVLSTQSHCIPIPVAGGQSASGARLPKARECLERLPTYLPCIAGNISLIIVMAAGPTRTTKMAGKMKITSGKINFTAVFAAFSSAICRRRVRIESLCTRSA